jgi:hypothetical protein
MEEAVMEDRPDTKRRKDQRSPEPFGDAKTSWNRQHWRSVVFARLSTRRRTARSIVGRDRAPLQA